MNEETGSPAASPETAPETGAESSLDAASAPTPDSTSLSADGAVMDGLPVEGDAGLVDRVIDIIHAGGPVVMILIALSVIAVAIVLVKLMQFGGARLGDRRPARDALNLWREGRVEEATSTAARSRNPVAQAVARALRGRHRRLPDAMVREEVLRYGGDVLQSLRSWLRPLEVIASLAPLLGLFGTVLGMITAFQQLEAAGNQVNPAILSGGIWVALLTTAVGLAVAMPVVVILNWLERRVDHLAHEMDDAVTRIFTEDLSEDLPQDYMQENSRADTMHREAPRIRPVTALAGE